MYTAFCILQSGLNPRVLSLQAPSLIHILLVLVHSKLFCLCCCSSILNSEAELS